MGLKSMETKDTFYKELASMVRYHRKKSGLNQLELAKLAGVGKTVVFDIEQGKESVQLNSLLKVLHVLNIKCEFNSPLMDMYRRDHL